MHLIKYVPSIFNIHTLDKKLFFKLYAQVCTRCFGWGLPCTAMVPACDNFNHNDVTVVQELVNTALHTKHDKKSSYWTRTKYMNDYTDLFQNMCPEKLAQMNEKEVGCVKGHFNRDQYDKHTGLYSQETWSLLLGGVGRDLCPNIEDAQDVWAVPYIRDTYDEDNDSTDSSSDEEDQMMNMLQTLISKKQKHKKKPVSFTDQFSKGLSWFIKKEKRLLRKKREAGDNSKKYDTRRFWMSEPRIDKKEYIKQEQEDKSDGESQETDEEFPWCTEEMEGETHFVYVNNNRKPFKAGDQLYYCYGNRSNRYLLVNYGFCFPGNRYESYYVNMRLDLENGEDLLGQMIDFDRKAQNCQQIRLKKDQLNDMMLAYLRTFLKPNFFKKRESGNTSIMLGKPVNLVFERYVMKFYHSVLTLLKQHDEQTTTLVDDNKILQEKTHNSFEEYMAIIYRIERKSIIYNQIQLVDKIQELLKGAEEAVLESPAAYRALVIK